MMEEPEEFSLAVSGDGRMLERFVPLLEKRFPAVIIYDRNEEAKNPPMEEDWSPEGGIPPHPQVANLDALFLLTDGKEIATIRNRRDHRFFNYISDPEHGGYRSLDYLLDQMIKAVEELIAPPPVAKPVAPETWEIPEVVPSEIPTEFEN